MKKTTSYDETKIEKEDMTDDEKYEIHKKMIQKYYYPNMFRNETR